MFFRSTCRTAAEGGHGTGYEAAGYTLVNAAHKLIEYRDDEEQAAKMEELSGLVCRPGPDGLVRSVHTFLAGEDAAAVLAWCGRELPRCMALVPVRRREAFLRGVYRSVIEEENDITTW